MTASIACPDAETLRQLAAGETPEPLSAVVAAHLQACAPCATLYDGLADPLLELLRQPAAPESGGDAVGEVAGRAKRLVGAADPAPPDATESYAPKGLGKFLLLSELGCGGMGVVYRARDTLLHRDVALKVIRPAGARGMSDAQRARFQREAQAAAGLRHDNVVTIFEVGEVAGTPFLVMPLLEGETLADRMRRTGAMPPAEVCRLGAQVADGLAAAHAAQLVHRDVKPSNLWVEPRRGGWVQLLDFGLVKPLGGAGDALTASHAMTGTPPYMSPEQADAGELDARSDLFSLGSVLYEMVAGRALFRNAAGLPPVLTQVRQFAPPTAESLLPGVHPGLAEVIAGLLQPAPAARIASADEVARRLRELRHDEPAASPVRRRPRRKVLVAVGLAFFAALAVVAFQVVIRIKKDEADPGVTLTVPPGARVVIDDNGVPTVTLKPDAPKPPAPAKPPARAADGLDSAVYLPFDPKVRREVTDFVEVHGVTPDELVKWGAALPAGTVPIFVGRHATGPNPPLVHAVAVRLAGDAPEVKVALSTWDVNPIPANWIQQAVYYKDPKRDWLGLLLSTTDSPRLRWQTAPKDFGGKLAEMRQRHYRPHAVVPDPWSDQTTTASYWVNDGGRDRWVVKPSLTAVELDEFVTECVRTDQCVVNAAAFVDAKGEVHFAAIGLENPERRDWDFLRDLDDAAYATELARHKADGFVPISVTSYGDDAPLYAAAWVRFKPRAKSPSDGVPWDKLAVPLPAGVAGRPLEATAFLPLDEGTKREVTDFSVLLDATPEAVCQWAKTLPAEYVPITLGSHASARPLQAHAVAVKLTNAPPACRPVWTRDRLPEGRFEARPGDGWRPVQRLIFESPEQGGQTLNLAAQDGGILHWYGWDDAVGWLAKVKAMREVQKCKPYIVNPCQLRTDLTAHYFMDQFGRDKWRVETGVTRDKVQALADEFAKAHLYVSAVTAYLDATGNLRFGVTAWENPDGRDTAFRTEMTRPELVKELAERKARGFCPVTVTSFGDPTNPRYAASWIRYDAKRLAGGPRPK